MPGIQTHGFEYTGKSKGVRAAVQAALFGFSTLSLPNSAGNACAAQLEKVIGEEGVRLRTLQLNRDTIHADLASILYRMACDGSDEQHLQCLCFEQCKWTNDAMAALAPAMLRKGGAPRLASLHLHHALTIPTECMECLRDVLVDSNCSITSLCMGGTLGLHIGGPPLTADTMTRYCLHNRITADAIERNKSVTHCGLGTCIVLCDELQAWSNALVANRTIRWLSISIRAGNRQAFQLIASTVPRFIQLNKGIHDLWIRFNMREDPRNIRPPGQTTMDLVRQAIRRNVALQSLAIGYSYDGSRNQEKAFVEYTNTIDAVADNPRMVFFDWRNFEMRHFTAMARRKFLPKLEEHRSRMSKIRTIVRHRAASDAKRDAGLVWRAAAEGRPLELARRLRLGVMAGGAEQKVAVGGVKIDAMQAAARNGHDECAKLLRRSLARERNRRAIHSGATLGWEVEAGICAGRGCGCSVS